MILEARCRKCGEHFNPNNEDDLIHLMRDDEVTECGGQGDLLGEYLSSPSEPSEREITIPTRSTYRPLACPCACNSGGFCGGCGHAGCGRR